MHATESRPRTTPASRRFAARFAARSASRAALLAGAALAVALAGCSGRDYTARDEPVGPRPGPERKYDPRYNESVFGEGGISLSNLRRGQTGGIFGAPGENEGMPVNKYIWQAALDTLSFLPLESTDPFTGVIVTEWGSTPEAPNERLKVTVYVTSPALSAASLKVAVFREVRDPKSGLWVPAPVSAETARKLEDAILARARELRIAAQRGTAAG